jgi:hypothetical protein
MQDTFTCDRCGQAFSIRQLKEAYREDDGRRHRESLCPSCLDIRMNESDRVKGIAGEDKRAAVRLEDVHETGKPVLPPRDELGIRDDGTRDIGDESQEERPSLRRMD